jgi:hypothetical protein
MKTSKKICLHFFVIFLAVLLCTFGESVEAKRFKLHKKIKVMTRNVYIGTDISIFFAAQGNPELLPGLVSQAYYEIVNTDFSYRAKALALEIAKERPDVVALQEVYKVYKDVSDFLRNPMANINFDTGEITPNATTIEFDYIQLLLDELEDLGLHYYVAVSQELTDAELPASLEDGDFDIRITDRDVILVRKGINATNPVVNIYETRLPFNFLAPADLREEVNDESFELVIFFTRGFVAVDVEIRGKKYHAVNTHLETRLEAFGPPAQAIQMDQAAELIDAIEGRPEPVILLGDFNSSREDPIVPITEGFVIIPPYKLLQLNGYRDVWVSRLNRRHLEGLTCCQAFDLSNTISDLYERVDLIWVKNTPYSWPFTVLGPVFANTVGDHPSPVSIVPGEEVFWPSDHAGVSAVLRIPIFK